MDLERSEVRELFENLSSKEWRLNNLYWIKDKNAKTVKFQFNPSQTYLYRNKHWKNVILKARQQGFTTFACIDALDDCLFNDNFDAGIIAHNLDDAEKIFTNKIKFAFDRLPTAIKAALKPNTDRAGELRFPNGSSISVSVGYRGGTLRKLHVSEFGKICAKSPEKAKEIISGAFNAVPLDGEITVESTAEGMSGDFYDMCEKAQLNKTLTAMDFKFHFFPWFESSDYRLNPAGIDVPQELTDYFVSLEKDHSIALDEWQRAWYFKKSEEQGDEMKQEYPSYPEEAFLASGRTVFNSQKIARDIRRASYTKGTRGNVAGSSFIEDSRGEMVIWEMPKDGHAYAIGADVAEGIEGGDYSVACVLNKNLEQVAVFHGHLDPDAFGTLLVRIAKLYNSALLAPEVNQHGHATLAAIKNAGYYSVYKREVKEELGRDITEKVGWHTNTKTKMLMLDGLIAAYREDSVRVNDAETLREMISLTIQDDGNVELTGKDRTVALAIALQVIKQATTGGEHKAFVPGQVARKDVTKMGLEEKIKYYKGRKF